MRNLASLVVIALAAILLSFGFAGNVEAEITEVGSLDIPMNYFHDVATVRLTAFVASSNGGLYVVDVSQPAEPRLMERYRGSCSGVEARGDYAFVGFNGEDGLRVFFIDSLIYSAEANVKGLLLEGDFLYLTEEADSANNTLKIFNVANPAEPALIGQLEIGHRGAPLLMVNDWLYLPREGQEWNELHFVDVSNPEEPELVHLQAMGQGSIADMVTDGRFVFVADQSGGGGVRVQDLDRGRLSVVRAGMPQGLALRDGRLFVGSTAIDQGSTIRVFDIQWPGHLGLVDEYSTGRQAISLLYDGQLCYVAEDGVDEDHPSRLLILNIEEADPNEHEFIVTDLLNSAGDQLAGGDSIMVFDRNHEPGLYHSASVVWSPGESARLAIPIVHNDPENGVEPGHSFSFRIYDSELGLWNRSDDFVIRDNSNGHFRTSGQTSVRLQENTENWIFPDPTHWPVRSTGSNHSLLIADIDWLSDFSEIAVLTQNGLVAGSGLKHHLQSDNLGLAAWGDDPTTQEVEGFCNNEPFSFMVWDHETDEEYPIDYEVVEGPETYTQDALTILRLLPEEGEFQNQLRLERGWNLVSSWRDLSHPDIQELFARLVEDGSVVMVKDGHGCFYIPEEGFNNIPSWNVVEGYQVKINSANGEQLPIDGELVNPETPIQLRRGWNTVAYFPQEAVGAAEAFQNLNGHLLFAKDGHGQFYLPRSNFSNMGALQRGLGYQVKVDQDIDLVWNVPQQIRAVPTRLYVSHFLQVAPTGSNMSVLVSGLKPSSEVGAFNKSGQLVGAGATDSQGHCGLSVWGDDETTKQIDGLKADEEFQLKVWNGSKEFSIPKALNFKVDGFEILEVDSKSRPFVKPVEFKLNGAYPNPFNPTTRIEFTLPSSGWTRLALFDLFGREVALLFDGKLASGGHSVTFSANGLPAGIYVVRLESDGLITSQKITLIK